ncbi:MAG: DUF5677 domain-containing protein [Kofleriaceae bacterium]
MATPTAPNAALQAHMHATVNAANESIALADAVSDAAIALQTEFGGLAATMLARAAQSLISVVELAQRGLVGDAMTVARTIVELTIDLGYIASDPATLVPRFTGYADVRDRELARAIAALHDGNVDQDAMRVLEERAEAYIGNDPASEFSWAGVGERERRGVGWRARHVRGNEATRRHYVRMYELLYADMCAASHSGPQTLEYTLVRRADGTVDHIRFGRQLPDTRPIDLAASALILMMDDIVEAFGIEGFADRISGALQALPDAEPPAPAE